MYTNYRCNFTFSKKFKLLFGKVDMLVVSVIEVLMLVLMLMLMLLMLMLVMLVVMLM